VTRYVPPAIDPRASKRAESLARDAGRRGAERIPTEALFPGGLDPSDSAVVRLLDAYLAGRLERAL
jgi:hypothetical protein